MRSLRLAVLAILLSPAIAAAVDITTCGQTVPARETGLLQNDLDCPVAQGSCADDAGVQCSNGENCASGRCVGAAGVLLEAGARLDLQGHTIRGGAVAIECIERSCEITSSLTQGVLESAGSACSGSIWGSANSSYPNGVRMVLSNLRVVGGGCAMIHDMPGRIFATDVSIENGTWGFTASALTGSNLSATGNTGYGVYVSGKIRVTNLTANGNAWGGIVGELRGANITANGNGGHGIDGSKVRGDGVAASNNAEGGIRTSKTSRLDGLTATNNGGVGYESIKGGGSLQNSTLTGNVGNDISTLRQPRLRNTVCGTSNGSPCPPN